MAKSIYDYFKDEENIKLLDKLKDLGLNMNYLGKQIESKYEKAKELGITIWNEEKLKEELNKINM